jgi:protocatechuate 3,4-dioxygenase beta subunit
LGRQFECIGETSYDRRWRGWLANCKLPSKILTHTIEGIIKDDIGNPVPGVAIYLNNQPYTVTDAQGAYRLSDLKTAKYTITPVLNGYVFSPSSYTLEVADDLKDKNFYASRSLGKGLSNGEQQSGEISQGNNKDNESNTPIVPQSENRGTLQPDGQEAAHPLGTPVQDDGNITSPIITPAPTNTPKINVFSVSGKITDIEQKPLAGIRITTNCGISTNSDSRGNFTLVFEKALDCQIIPLDEKYIFSPPKIELRAFTLTADGVLEGQQFIGIANAKRGRVLNEEGKGLAGVKVKVNEKVLETDQEGYYDLPNLQAGIYTLVPMMENYSFTPAEVVCKIPYPCELTTFIGKQEWRNIQGKVIDEKGKPIEGVLLFTDKGQITQTDKEGKFNLSIPLQEIVITPQKQGFVFTPSSLVVQLQQMTEEFIIKAEPQKNLIT